jgi:hypothetical protein
MKRTSQAEQREALLLAAQSQLTELRVHSNDWPSEQAGKTIDGFEWRAVAVPFKTNITDDSAWKAVNVTLSVSDPHHPAWSYALQSIELTYQKAGSKP